MRKRKICIVTGSRAEYGLLYWLIKEVEANNKLDLQLIITGMHLSPKFGLTYKEIEKDFKIDKKIDLFLSSDTSMGISRSMGAAQTSFSEAYNELNPDIVLVLGDRYEIFSAASAAMIATIPIAHIHGGELTEGSFDDAMRHCITKMSHLHFVSNEVYKRRVIQLGEQPDRVFNTGALGVDNIKKIKLIKKKKLETNLKFKFLKKNLLITFHPVTLESNSNQMQINELFKALSKLKGFGLIFTMPNSDVNNSIIFKKIREFCTFHKNAKYYLSLGQTNYFSCLKYVDAVVGNSSSGILEVPSFKKPTINIGDRQKGRLQAQSIINCKMNSNSILNALKKAFSQKSQTRLKSIKNPYHKLRTCKNIVKILEKAKFNNILKKSFYDLKKNDYNF